MIIEQDLHGSFSKDRFCHQFILGPRFIDSLVGWQHTDVSDSLKLTLHPEVTVEQISDGNKSITLIGYILDPQNPESSNADIIQNLLKNFSAIKGLANQTAKYGGRWIIVAQVDGQSGLFNDALGLRQIFYTTPGFTDGFWAMSQPGILAWVYDLTIDPEAARFIDSYEFRNMPEYRWPGKATAFREIHHLLPNHYLNSNTGNYHRFWPNQQLEKVSFDEGVEKATDILKGLMQAAHHRFELVVGMTAGIDSRVVLAASRDIKDNLVGITVRQGRMLENHQDLRIASSLLGRLAIPHKIFKALPFMSAAFSKVFKQNVFMAHDHYGPDVEVILDQLSRSKVVATGSGAEVARDPYIGFFNSEKTEFSANDLARLQNMEGNEFALKYFTFWLEGTGDLYNIHLLELFGWEQGHGNWLAGTQLEFDLAWKDLFTPFNCRELLVCLLSIDLDKRNKISSDDRLFISLIENMWPELLQEPINPDDKQTKRPSRQFIWRVIRAIKRRLCYFLKCH